ncbi:ABC1 kinase family protein [Paenibacillus physcomitrellae]|uniref:ABC transporter n=1 Tax=Paenibacillus physcomitrellae TaxID=1619311 RepID=A0ABQ1FX85_9BACL|nr:AarF/ABC1/UbiB kinase family protein [Paenibacillus physcomitrellae]GGA32222.1 ABC transporter [Paenibacillus physcomitrellae]
MKAGKRVRHLLRYREIASALVRNGFGYIAHELGFPDHIPFKGRKEESHPKTRGERIRLILEELGPTYVKIGQIASTRPDLLPADIIAELEKLQDNVPPFSYEAAAAIVEEELGGTIEELFLDFARVPMAAASIGQVHEAVLPDGSRVAVKVQRPKVEQVIRTDLDILLELSRIAEERLEWAKHYRVREIAEEIAKVLNEELDYTLEARNGEKISAQSLQSGSVRTPNLYWEYCTRRVLTMEFLTGIKLTDAKRLEAAGVNRKQLASRIASVIFHQILVEGFFHGDPHPGNFLVLPGGELAMLDFGMVGRLSPSMKQHFASMVIALRSQSSKGIIRAIAAMGIVPDEVNESKLFDDVEQLRERYYNVPLSQISLGEAVNDMFRVAFRHRIMLPSELTLVGKALLTMEGVVTALDPDISVFDIAEPYGLQLLKERVNPVNVFKQWSDKIPDYWDLLTDVPKNIKILSTLVKKGKVQVELTVPELNAFLRRLDRVSNRVSFSIVLLSFSILMTGLIIASAMSSQQSVLWNFPVIEIGLIISGILVAWLILAIFRSGRF